MAALKPREPSKRVGAVRALKPPLERMSAGIRLAHETRTAASAQFEVVLSTIEDWCRTEAKVNRGALRMAEGIRSLSPPALSEEVGQITARVRELDRLVRFWNHLGDEVAQIRKEFGEITAEDQEAALRVVEALSRLVDGFLVELGKD